MSRLPRRWATTTPFASGVDAGTPSRVDPSGASAAGFLPHTGVPAQFLNHLFGETLDVLHEYISTPDRKLRVREDFGTVVQDTDLLYAERVWRTDEDGTVGVTHTAGTPDGLRPGQLIVSVTPDSEFSLFQGNATETLTKFEFLERMTINVRVDDDPANIATRVVVGLMQDPRLASGGTDALALFYDPSKNWCILIRKAGASTVEETTIPVVSGEWVTFNFEYVPTLNRIQIKINEFVVYQLEFADWPEDGCNFGAHFFSSVADTENLVARVDLMDLVCDMPDQRWD